MLKINPRASGTVRIPISTEYEVTVDALRDVEHAYLAQGVELSQEEFESEIKKWAQGEGLPYGILVVPWEFRNPEELS